jgi:mono/diheme cytochrome c family protein
VQIVRRQLWILLLVLIGLAGGGVYALYKSHEQAVVLTQDTRYAQAGAALFEAECETCHGVGGDGAGGAPILNNGAVLKSYPTESALEAFIVANMPASDPGSLTPTDAQDLAYYILSLNRALP